MTTKRTIYGAEISCHLTDSSAENWRAVVRIFELSPNTEEGTPGKWISFSCSDTDLVTYQISGTLSNLKKSPDNWGFYSFGDWGLDTDYRSRISTRDAMSCARLAQRLEKRCWKLDEEHGTARGVEQMLLRVFHAIKPVAIRRHSMARSVGEYATCWSTVERGNGPDMFRAELRVLKEEIRKRHPEVFEIGREASA
jgi:hypothetical protein